jgi:hypothetical protein
MEPTMETVLSGIARRDRLRRHLAIGLAALVAAVLGVALVLLFLARTHDEPDKQAVAPSCPITARVHAAQQTNPERHDWLVTTLRDACTRDHWPDDYLTCVATGGDDCASRLAVTGARTSGVFAIANGPIACLSAAKTMQWVSACNPSDTDSRAALNDLGAELERGVTPSCVALGEVWARVATQACAPPPPTPVGPPPPPIEPPAQAEPGEVGYLTLTSKPRAKILIDHVDTGRMTPITGRSLPLAPGKHRVTFWIGDDKYTFPATIHAGQTTALVKDFQ